MDDVAYSVAWQGLGRILTAGRHCINLEFGCGSAFGTVNKTTYSYIEGAGFIWSFEVDTDYDGIADVDDNCPTINNTAQLDMDGDNIGDVCDGDADSDTLDDYWDDCIGPAVNWDQSVWMSDRDGDGCRDDSVLLLGEGWVPEGADLPLSARIRLPGEVEGAGAGEYAGQYLAPARSRIF